MNDISNLRFLRLSESLIGFYDGRVSGQRFAPGPNWVDDGALSLGICSYVLIDGDEALIYDTHVSAAHGAHIRQTLEKLKVRKMTVVLSHWHLDHIAGNSAFADCEIIAHRLTLNALENNRAAIETGTQSGLPAISPLVLPGTAYEDELTLSIGSLEVQLKHVPAHSADGTVIHVPSESLLLAGDTLEDTVPYVDEPETLPSQLDALEKMWGWQIERIFPNHGDPAVIENGGYRKPLIRAGQQYLRTLMRAAKEAEVAALPLKEFIAGPLTAGWVNYHAPYERVHQENLAAVKAVT